MEKRQSCSIDRDDKPTRPNQGTAQARKPDESGPAKVTGAFERYRAAVSEAAVAQMLQGRSVFSREGRLSAWVVIWLMIYQRLHAKGTLAVAVREMRVGAVRGLVGGSDGEPLSANTSAYSQARSRVPLDVAEKVSDLLFESLRGESKILSGLEKPMFLLDGSSILLQQTKELATAYPPQGNQYVVSHWPIMRVLVAHDVVSALAVRPCWGPMSGAGAVSEQGMAKEIMARLPLGCGVMGDRNFGVFSMAHHAHQQNHPCLFRLTEARARKLNGGATPNAGTDQAIRWSCSRDDRRTNPELAEQSSVEGRLVVCNTREVDGKRQKLYFFTTLDLSADQILEVYGYRWNIETDLRSLKREVRLHLLDAKSKAMVEKELVLAVAAYNLTRAAMNQAASALQLNPRQFSFSLAQDTLNAYLPAFANATTDRQREELMQDMLLVFKQSLLPNRSKRRSYSRAIWPRSNSFPKRKLVKSRGVPGKRKVSKKGVA